jgi:tetratricopeptide (TPR) repeat protein
LSGLNADSYCASKIKVASQWECTFETGVDWFKVLFESVGLSDKVEEPLLAFATILDQQQVGPEILEELLPKSLLNKSALACLLMGRAFVRSSMDEKAADIFFQGASINLTFAPLRRQLGLTLLKMGRYQDAALHLEASLGLRNDAGVQSGSFFSAILVTRPCNDAEVYFYKNYFYSVPRNPKVDGPSVIVIGNELYELKKNAIYLCARALLRIPLIRQLVMGLRGLTTRDLVPNSPVNINSVGPEDLSNCASWLPTLRTAAVSIFRAIFLRVALLTLAGRVSFKSASFQDAITNAQELSLKNDHVRVDLP